MGALVLQFVVACSGSGAVVNGQCGIGTAAVECVGVFASGGSACDGDDAVSIAKAVSDDGVVAAAVDGCAEGEGVNEGGLAAAASVALAVGVVSDSIGVEGTSGVDKGAVAQVALAVAFSGRVSAVVAETRVLQGVSDVRGDGMGGFSVGGGEVKSRMGLAACANGTGEMALASEGDSEGIVLLWLRSSLQWVLAVRGSLLLLLLSLTHVKSSLVSRPLLPRLYMNVPSSLMLKSLRFHRGCVTIQFYPHFIFFSTLPFQSCDLLVTWSIT